METTSIQNQEEQHSENVTSTQPSNESSEKVRAGEDVIKYAETHELQSLEKKEEPAQKPVKENKPKERTLKGIHRGTGKEVEVPLSKIASISRYIYVHNIFDPTPVIEHVQYKVIAPDTTYITFDITEEAFLELEAGTAYKGKIHYNYVDDMAKNNPDKNGFYHRTFSVNYPEWIKPEDVQKQAQGIVSHYGLPDLSGIEKLLWPNFEGKVQKQSLASDETTIVEEAPEPALEEQQDTPEE